MINLYQGVGEVLTHHHVDVDGAALTRQAAVTLPTGVQYAWPHPSRRYHLYGGVEQRRAARCRCTANPGHCRTGHCTWAPTPAGIYALVAYNAPSVHRIEPEGTVGAHSICHAPRLHHLLAAAQFSRIFL